MIPMPEYGDEVLVGRARARYFEANGFGSDGGYAKDWVRFKVGPIPIAFPNTAARKAAVPCHDLHHVATGYETDLVGEGEIGAWEIASGCAHMRAALILNLLAVWPVLFYAPGRVYRAFLRGRHSRNLYDGSHGEAVLALTVGALRTQLRLDASPPPATAADRIAFVGFLTRVVGLQVGLLVLVFGFPAWVVFG